MNRRGHGGHGREGGLRPEVDPGGRAARREHEGRRAPPRALAGPLAELLRVAIDRHKLPARAKVVALGGADGDGPLASSGPGPWLFCPGLTATPTRKDAARSYKAIRRAFARALKVAALPSYFTPHSLRHSFGSLLIAAGESPAYVQQQMGHASISMTVDVYGSWLPSGPRAPWTDWRPPRARMVTRW